MEYAQKAACDSQAAAEVPFHSAAEAAEVERDERRQRREIRKEALHQAGVFVNDGAEPEALIAKAALFETYMIEGPKPPPPRPPAIPVFKLEEAQAWIEAHQGAYRPRMSVHLSPVGFVVEGLTPLPWNLRQVEYVDFAEVILAPGNALMQALARVYGNLR